MRVVLVEPSRPAADLVGQMPLSDKSCVSADPLCRSSA